jgi:hypothetical protein
MVSVEMKAVIWKQSEENLGLFTEVDGTGKKQETHRLCTRNKLINEGGSTETKSLFVLQISLVFWHFAKCGVVRFLRSMCKTLRILALHCRDVTFDLNLHKISNDVRSLLIRNNVEWEKTVTEWKWLYLCRKLRSNDAPVSKLCTEWTPLT